MTRPQKKISDILQPTKKRSPQKTRIYPGIGLFLAVLFSLWVGWQWSNNDIRNVQKDTYQAVTLSNNQLYFGKITKISDTTITLEDVYYIATPPTSSESTTDPQKDSTIIRPLRKAVYSPENILYLNKDQLIGWQNLKPDSQVVKSISDQR